MSDYSHSLIPGSGKDEIAMAISSTSYEFPFLPNKSDQINYRGIIIYYDTRTLQPVRGYPLVETGNTGVEKMIRTGDGRILFTGIAQWWYDLIPPPVKSTGFQTKLTSNNDVYVGIFHEPAVSAITPPEDVPGEFGLTMYPQPAHDMLQVTANTTREATFTLRDLLGRERNSVTAAGNGGVARARFDLKGLVPGIYLLTAKTATGIQTRNVIVAR